MNTLKSLTLLQYPKESLMSSVVVFWNSNMPDVQNPLLYDTLQLMIEDGRIVYKASWDMLCCAVH